MAFFAFLRLSSPLSASFFSPRKALSGSKFTFYRPDDACRLLPASRFFAFSRAVLPTFGSARSLEIRTKVDFALVHINRFDANFHAIAQGDKSGRWIPHRALPYLVKALVSHLSSEETWTRPSMNKVVQTDEEAKASDAGNYAFKRRYLHGRAGSHTSASQRHRALLRRHDVPPSNSADPVCNISSIR